MNTPAVIVALIILFGALLVVIRLWFNNLEEKTKLSPEMLAWMRDIGFRLESSTRTVDEKLSRNMEMFNKRLDNATSVIAQVQKNIGEFSEIGRSMQELQQFLNSPKLRGNLGEQVLKELLAQNFPQGTFELQYGFKNGEKVDAVIKTSQGMIPIDSKFPVENFRKMADCEAATDKDRFKKLFIQDVRKHIHDISRKYILPNEGTVDYALIYIPSESVYYEVINSPEVFDYAGKMRILPVSPMSFYAYMKAILMSFEGQRIQSQVKEILAVLQSLAKEYEKTEEAISVLNRHVTNAYNQSANVGKHFASLGQKIDSVRQISPGAAPTSLPE